MLYRIRAALVHLCLSACMACVALAVVYLVWYPSPLAAATGVSGVVLLFLAVDVVLGPILTLLVYKRGKKSLRLDLSIIVALQLAAFSYGFWSIAVARPAWLVFNVERFDLAQAHELDSRFLMDTRPEFRAPSWTGPRWVSSNSPADLKKRNQLVMESALGGPDLPQRVDLYVPLASEAPNLRAKAHDLEELGRYNSPAEVQAALGKWPQADAWLPLMARVQPMVVLVKKADGKPLAVVNLRPWS